MNKKINGGFLGGDDDVYGEERYLSWLRIFLRILGFGFSKRKMPELLGQEGSGKEGGGDWLDEERNPRRRAVERNTRLLTLRESEFLGFWGDYETGVEYLDWRRGTWVDGDLEDDLFAKPLC